MMIWPGIYVESQPSPIFKGGKITFEENIKNMLKLYEKCEFGVISR
jgi:hypothetical protein